MNKDELFQNWLKWLKSDFAISEISHLTRWFNLNGQYSCKISYLSVQENGPYSAHVTVNICFIYLHNQYATREQMKKQIEDEFLHGDGNVHTMLSRDPFKLTVSIRFI